MEWLSHVAVAYPAVLACVVHALCISLLGTSNVRAVVLVVSTTSTMECITRKEAELFHHM